MLRFGQHPLTSGWGAGVVEVLLSHFMRFHGGKGAVDLMREADIEQSTMW